MGERAEGKGGRDMHALHVPTSISSFCAAKDFCCRDTRDGCGREPSGEWSFLPRRKRRQILTPLPPQQQRQTAHSSKKPEAWREGPRLHRAVFDRKERDVARSVLSWNVHGMSW